MRDRIGRALHLLQQTPLPVDLVENPSRTDQWLDTLQNLHLAMTTLLAGRTDTRTDRRADRLMRRFAQMTSGLPQASLSGLSPVIKLGLLHPLLTDLEGLAREIGGRPGLDTTPLEYRLQIYRRAAGTMAARLGLAGTMPVPAGTGVQPA
ncbi:hypothetical protein [Ferrovibrio sp.]|uniref:hypothetical protein n=1 Tax=Ferrovibrio sp. TaxID=1917215 RepID=UPI00311ECC60